MVSIIIAAYKDVLLEKAIRSVLNQTIQDFELIVVDDCSPMAIKQIVNKFSDARIRYTRLERNSGYCYAYNIGVFMAKGEIVAFLDDDDEWDSRKLEKQLAVLKGCDFCFCAFEREGKVWPDTSVDSSNLFKNILSVPLVTTSTIVVKKECFNRLGGFDPGINNIADYELSLRLSLTYSGIYIDEVLVHQGTEGHHLSDNDNCEEGLRVRCKLYREYWIEIHKYHLEEKWQQGFQAFKPYCKAEVFAYEMDRIAQFHKNVGNSKTIGKDNIAAVKSLLRKVILRGLDFKTQSQFMVGTLLDFHSIGIADAGLDDSALIDLFTEKVMPCCSNFSNTGFAGFPDAGNSVPGLVGAVFSDLLQQNLINQSYCSPAATFIEMEVINVLRKVIGFPVKHDINSIEEIGGIVTNGGTGSNTTAMLMACNYFMEKNNLTHLGKNYKIIVPKGIGHYSIRCSLDWIHCAEVLEVDAPNYRYDIDALIKALNEHKGEVVAVVCYACDSRTMTVEHLDKVIPAVKNVNKHIWCHVDACHGFSLAFSRSFSYKLKGIELADSVSCDPHKVFALPYCCSVFLVNDPQKFRYISTKSDLITNGKFDFGKITPFIGSKSWISLKLWFFMKSLGLKAIGEMIDRRAELARLFARKIKQSRFFKVINSIDYNSVVILCDVSEITCFDKNSNYDVVSYTNNLMQKIYRRMLADGKYYLHQFPIVNFSPDFAKNVEYYCLRYMSGNDRLSENDLDKMVRYLDELVETLNH